MNIGRKAITYPVSIMKRFKLRSSRYWNTELNKSDLYLTTETIQGLQEVGW